MSFFSLSEIQLIYNIVLVLGEQQRDSAIHTHTHILFHYRLLQDTEYSSLCYTVNPYCLPVLYIVVCTCSKLLIYLSPIPLIIVSLFSMSVSLFLFCKQVHAYSFLQIPHMRHHMIFVFLCQTYFTQYDNFQIHLCCRKCHYFVLFPNNIPLYTCTTSSLPTHLLMDISILSNS